MFKYRAAPYTKHMEEMFQGMGKDINDLLAQPSAYRSVLILITAIVVSYIASRFLAQAIIFIAQKVSLRGDKSSNDAELVRMRQVETYLSITVAIVRAAVVAVTAYVAWRLLSPFASSGAAAIGASAFFVVFAGQTLGMVLRDLTAGVIMITEGWFHVGDHIKVEPFVDVSGVVERFTLRSTRIRSLSGEIICIHNQQMQAVHVTPNGVRTLAVDLFTRDVEAAKSAVGSIVATLPESASLLSKRLEITQVEEWGDGMHRIVVIGQTIPGREWLIERFFVDAIKEVDEGKTDKAEHVFAYEPIARYADPVAEQKFKRAIRTRR